MALDIEEWEIWHTYSTFLHSTKIDLEESARRLVTAGIAEYAVVSDGRSYWRSNGSIGSGLTQIDVDTLTGNGTFTLQVDDDCKTEPEGFAMEAWGQASYFQICEHRVLGEDIRFSAPYIRAYLGKVHLTSASKEKTHVLNLYPVLLVYATGILTLEFRMIGPSASTSLENFITGGVNLFQYKFDEVEVIPGLSEFATRAYYQTDMKAGLVRRLAFAWLQARHDLAVKVKTKTQSDGDFIFDLAPLSNSEGNDLKAVALTIFHTAAFIISRPRLGFSFILFGQPPAPSLGEFWSGRPHIHILRFRGQCNTAAQNEDCHAADFGRILSRVPVIDDDAARDALPQDARWFQDFSAYITSAASLWVWSKDGLEKQKRWSDPNRGNLIYERQVLVELLEYGYMLHRSLYHRVEMLASTDEVMAVRRDLLKLRLKMREASCSGEIRKLLEHAWNELGVTELAAEIDRSLEIRALETNAIEAKRVTRVGWAIALVFGFVAVPDLAEKVIQPLWELSALKQFPDAAKNDVVADVIAVFLVVVVLAVSCFFVSRRKR